MRVRVVVLQAQAFIDRCKSGPARVVEVVAHGRPADARFIRAGIDLNGDLRLVVESAEWPGGMWFEQVRFDACLSATHDAHDCTLAYPMGSH
jgi:hypothetical protein